MYMYIVLLDNYIKLMYIYIYIKNDTVMFTRQDIEKSRINGFRIKGVERQYCHCFNDGRNQISLVRGFEGGKVYFGSTECFYILMRPN